MGLERKIIADLDGVPYPIYIGRDVLGDIVSYVQSKTKNNKILIVADVFFKESIANEIEQNFISENYSVYTHYLDAGKGNKNINEILKIYSILEENNLARDSTLIAIGGGVIGDMAGFVASTWLRGMNLVHVPTTLMAMIDSSVGGKTAINFRQTINAIGNYYHPIANIIDLNLIDSLSDRDYRSGIAEVIKCGIINDKNFYNYLISNFQKINQRSQEHVVEFVKRTIEIKINHVQGDVREGGKRLLLNYGHTLGHSVEISTVKNSHEQLRHGEGVSIGIMAVAYVASKHLNVPQDVYDSFKELFELYSLPVNVSASALGFEREKLLAQCIKNVNKDKKRLNNRLRLILATEIGKAAVFDDVPFGIIEDAFDHIIRE